MGICGSYNRKRDRLKTATEGKIVAQVKKYKFLGRESPN
jgi:hypothetical protein